MDQGAEFDVSKLTQRDKEELQQFIHNETQKSKIQQSMSPAPPLLSQASGWDTIDPTTAAALSVRAATAVNADWGVQGRFFRNFGIVADFLFV